MQIRIFTIPLFGGDESLDEMNKFLRGNKVVDINKNLVQQGDVTYWSFCVTYLIGVPPKNQPVYLRYMDDILFFGNDKLEMLERIDSMRCSIKPLLLQFKPMVVAKTEVGVSFLGYRLRRHRLTLNARSSNRLKKKLRNYADQFENFEWGEESVLFFCR